MFYKTLAMRQGKLVLTLMALLAFALLFFSGCQRISVMLLPSSDGTDSMQPPHEQSGWSSQRTIT